MSLMFLLEKGKAWEQWAITVNWVTNGVDSCHVGFLPHNCIKHAWVYDGVLCQVIEVFDDKHPNCTTRENVYRNKGFTCIAVISQLNSGK